MLTMEVSDERPVYNPSSRDPDPFFWAITLPVNQVLDPSASTSGPEQPPDSVDQATIDKAWRRRRRSSWD